MSQRLPTVQCQRKLLFVWAGLGGAALLIVLVQTSPTGVYHGSASDVWDWFLPNLVPTLSLMIGTLVAQARESSAESSVDVFYYRLALWSSFVYLVLLIAVLLMYAGTENPLAELKGTAKVLTAIYGIVGLALGAFFVSKSDRKE